MKSQKRTSIAMIADILIVLSLIGFGFIVYPIVSAYIIPGKILSPKELQGEKGFFIYIPKIHASSQIIMHVDPWNEDKYKEALHHGVAQAKGSAEPGEYGTSFLFAHSSGAPWELTHTNTLFLRLGELISGDSIAITNNGKISYFTVYDKKEVWPNQVDYLESSIESHTKKDKYKQLILQTCTPIGTSLKRLLLFAKSK